LVQVISRVFDFSELGLLLKMAPSKSLKLVSSCPKNDLKAKLSEQKFLRILPQTGITHKISMLACCITDFL
jgi:hypothetical protein